MEWAQVRALVADGVSQREIAARLGINRRRLHRGHHPRPPQHPQHRVGRIPKGGKVRSVPLADRAAEVLDALTRRGDWTGEADLVFVHVYDRTVDAGHLRVRFH